jgi:HEPN domain-containing protein
LQELGIALPRIHDLTDLLNLLVPHDATLKPLRRGLASLSRYAVDYRYPGCRANARQARAAHRNAQFVRKEIRLRLKIKPKRVRRRKSS